LIEITLLKRGVFRVAGFLKGLLTGTALGAITISWFSSSKKPSFFQELGHEIDEGVSKQQVEAKRAAKDFTGNMKRLLRK